MSAASAQAPAPKVAALVAAELRRRITTGELQPGDRLPPEGGLMEEFDLARTTLREALRILESEGLITVQRGRNGGPRVTAPPVDRLAQAFAVHLQLQQASMGDIDSARQIIEPMLAGAMAASHTDADLEALEDAIASAATAAMAGDRQAFADGAAAVHATLVERGGNTTLALVAQMLRGVMTEYYRFAATETNRDLMERAVRSYRRLRRYIESGDAEGAAEHWRKQMAWTVSRIDKDQVFEIYRTDGPHPAKTAKTPPTPKPARPAKVTKPAKASKVAKASKSSKVSSAAKAAKASGSTPDAGA